MRLVAYCLCATLLAAGAASALDRPIDATKITLKRNNAGAKALTFVTKDPAMPFPAVASADDPATGTPGGVLVELFSGNEGVGSFTVPPCKGKPGWAVTTGSVASYKFTNSGARRVLSVAKAIVIRQGELLKIAAKDVPLPLVVPQQRIGIRVTMGTLRACAMFLLPRSTRTSPASSSASSRSRSRCRTAPRRQRRGRDVHHHRVVLRVALTATARERGRPRTARPSDPPAGSPRRRPGLAQRRSRRPAWRARARGRPCP